MRSPSPFPTILDKRVRCQRVRLLGLVAQGLANFCRDNPSSTLSKWVTFFALILVFRLILPAPTDAALRIKRDNLAKEHRLGSASHLSCDYTARHEDHKLSSGTALAYIFE